MVFRRNKAIACEFRKLKCYCSVQGSYLLAVIDEETNNKKTVIEKGWFQCKFTVSFVSLRTKTKMRCSVAELSCLQSYFK